MRTEPMGERLRVLYNADPVIGPAGGAPHDMAGKPFSPLKFPFPAFTLQLKQCWSPAMAKIAYWLEP